MSDKSNSQLALATALTTRTNQLCIGLEDGIADIFELVTPTTAELLRWWFGIDMTAARQTFNFHSGQKQAILNTIVAHEVLGITDLKMLYQQLAPDALLTGARLIETSQTKHEHPKYCLKMATGTGKTWVLQALLVWQLLNKTAAVENGIDDPRFTRQFLIVAPGLIVYERLLDAFCGKLRDGVRDFSSSDVAQYAELFIPEAHRERVFGFIRGNVCNKTEIGLKATGNGMVAITNWHLLADVEEDAFGYEKREEDMMAAPGQIAEPSLVLSGLLPLTPGKSTGNSLDVLDRRYARGNVLEFLAKLPDLMVFNDEAHHIHEFKKEGETNEVEWQKSLTRIAENKGRRFVQVDFSATPYNDVGSGKNKKKVYFPHIVVDFDLTQAMRQGLVKSLVLDKRKELGALPLEFKAERDADGNAVLSEGQCIMLRAGLQKLKKLEADFYHIDSDRHPKMLVVCEDTTVSPLVVQFLQNEGLNEDEVMSIDSGKKAELGEKDWAPVRERLFNVDKHKTPRVIVSVLMLREGFDVNNICVIVPLRSSQAQILLEQTIGRGLRLMWREPEYSDIKDENRASLKNGKAPGSLIDVLTIIEHPAFQAFYDELMQEGLAGTTDEDDDETNGGGDLVAAELIDTFANYDFAIPFILRETEELLEHELIDISSVEPFTAMSQQALRDMLGKGDVFTSQDLQSSTLFGDYRVDGAVMNINGYNELLARLTRRISQALSSPLPRGNKIAHHLNNPYLQTNTVQLAQALDDYIHERLFNEWFEPIEDEKWRLLLLSPVVEHIVQKFALALLESEDKPVVGATEVKHRLLSEVTKLMVRETASLLTKKCIYDRLPFPTRSGGLEKAFIEWSMADSSIEAFCKISETRHDFVRLRYVKEDGLPAFYSPDFLVRTTGGIYLVETKAQQQTVHPNVQRKLKAAVTWCERINALEPYQRTERNWHYVLLGESLFHDWRSKGAKLSELLEFSRIRPAANKTAQLDLLKT
ncbi:MAG TPA: DEAD/DEAH box helicase family protein [Pseudomonadales bacterium]|nr:DEAD/DEAH box helicase family protein [Pseudomonadales bacterium]